MRTPFHKMAYFAVLMAMMLLMGERLVPHHHCEGCSVSYGSVAETIHFGFGECEECEHAHCGHSHDHTDGDCCDGSQQYFRIADNNVQLDKKPVVPLYSLYLLQPELQLQSPGHTRSYNTFHYRLRIPDVTVLHAALRAPPVA